MLKTYILIGLDNELNLAAIVNSINLQRKV